MMPPSTSIGTVSNIQHVVAGGERYINPREGEIVFGIYRKEFGCHPTAFSGGAI